MAAEARGQLSEIRTASPASTRGGPHAGVRPRDPRRHGRDGSRHFSRPMWASAAAASPRWRTRWRARGARSTPVGSWCCRAASTATSTWRSPRVRRSRHGRRLRLRHRRRGGGRQHLRSAIRAADQGHVAAAMRRGLSRARPRASATSTSASTSSSPIPRRRCSARSCRRWSTTATPRSRSS